MQVLKASCVKKRSTPRRGQGPSLVFPQTNWVHSPTARLESHAEAMMAWMQKGMMAMMSKGLDKGMGKGMGKGWETQR